MHCCRQLCALNTLFYAYTRCLSVAGERGSGAAQQLAAQYAQKQAYMTRRKCGTLTIVDAGGPLPIVAIHHAAIAALQPAKTVRLTADCAIWARLLLTADAAQAL